MVLWRAAERVQAMTVCAHARLTPNRSPIRMGEGRRMESDRQVSLLSEGGIKGDSPVPPTAAAHL